MIDEDGFDPDTALPAEMVTIGALRKATESGLSPLIGQSLAAAINTAYGDQAQEDSILALSDAAVLLSVALLPVAREGASLPSLGLMAVELAWEGREVTLTPAQALSHPALKDWLAPSWAEQVAHALRAGALMTFAAPNAPNFDFIEAADQGGAIARTVLHWRGFRATAVFGRPWNINELTCSVHLPGALLRGIGAQLLRTPTPAPIPTPTASEEPQAAAPSIH